MDAYNAVVAEISQTVDDADTSNQTVDDADTSNQAVDDADTSNQAVDDADTSLHAVVGDKPCRDLATLQSQLTLLQVIYLYSFH